MDHGASALSLLLAGTGLCALFVLLGSALLRRAKRRRAEDAALASPRGLSAPADLGAAAASLAAELRADSAARDTGQDQRPLPSPAPRRAA